MTLTRTRYKIPDYIREGLTERNETKEKRLTQMLDELEGGKIYMNMNWHPRR